MASRNPVEARHSTMVFSRYPTAALGSYGWLADSGRIVGGDRGSWVAQHFSRNG